MTDGSPMHDSERRAPEPIRVLIVEDEVEHAELLQAQLAQLEEWQVQWDWASSYASAAAELRRGHHDLCFCDYQLGEHTGHELLALAQAESCSVPIVMLTAHSDPAITRTAAELGAADFLLKTGVDLQNLDRVIRYALQRARTAHMMQFRAQRDALTELPNRRLLVGRIAQAIATASQSPERGVAMLYLDLDRFKRVNDSLGHQTGDRLLQQVASRLEACVRDRDVVARLGGDEFAILLQGRHMERVALQVAERVLESLSRPFVVDGHLIQTGASIGVAQAHEQDGPQALLEAADHAMYASKRKGRGRIEVFSEDLRAQAVERLRMEEELRGAIEEEALSLVYQPIVDNDRGEVDGWEALARWIHPTRGFVSPGVFIPLAEESGLIQPLGWWVLNEACRQAAAWHAAGIARSDATMSVNLAPAQLASPDLMEQVIAALDASGLSPQHLVLEITESALLHHLDVAAQAIQRLRNHGVKVYLDDFGTGYSSLAYLDHFPLDGIKIDRAFLEDVASNRRRASIVLTIIQLGRILDLDIVAEGVETERQLLALGAMGCRRIQGYYFARPMSPADVAAFRVAKEAA